MSNGNGEITDQQREVRSFLMSRDPSVDRRFRPRPERQVRLFEGVVEVDGEEFEDGNSSFGDAASCESDVSSATASTVAYTSDVDSGAQVFLRLRPVDVISTSYIISEGGNVLVTRPSNEAIAASTSTNRNTMEKHYSFSAIFDSEVDQCEVYGKCIGEKVESDESFTVLTYGTSGSGKTFTLLGDHNRPGILPRALENIFTHNGSNIYPTPCLKMVKTRVEILDDDAQAKELRRCQQMLSVCPDLHAVHEFMHENIKADHSFQSHVQPNVSVMIWVSFAEIYNEMVYDLLRTPLSHVQMAAPPRENLKVIGNDGKVFIKGLTALYVKSSLEALQLLRYGLQHVSYASTSINSNSSRSHCIFFVDVLKYHISGVITEISYKFCDLAGSERITKTGTSGSRLKEAQRINTSLLVLGRCLDAANRNKKSNTEVIPYRESKLTMILQSALLGKEKLTMIVNVTPTDAFYEENLNVLGFSSIAKNIIFKAPPVKQNTSRYSFLSRCPEVERDLSGARNASMEKLIQENMECSQKIQSLLSEIETLKLLHQNELLQLEQDIRTELVDSFEKSRVQSKVQSENRLQRELESQKRLYEMKISSMKRKYEEEIEDLREELEDAKENAADSNNKKRRTIQ